MHRALFFVGLLLVSCRKSDGGQVLGAATDSSTRQVELVALQRTAIKSQPLSSSDPNVGALCWLAANQRIVVRGTAEYASGQHLRVFVASVGASDAPSGALPEPESEVTPDSVDALQSESGSSGIANAVGVGLAGEGSDCRLVGRQAYLYSSHFSGLDAVLPKSPFPDYSPQIGNDLANAIQKPAFCSPRGTVVSCGGNSSSTACCYSCVASPDSSNPGALSRPLPSLGRAIWPVGSAPELNQNQYARSFAEHFVPGKHDVLTHMRPAYLRGKVDRVGGAAGRFQMPRGSIIVWSSCSTNPAGHIAIVTEPGKTACSDFCGSLDQCPAQNVIGLFYPFR